MMVENGQSLTYGTAGSDTVKDPGDDVLVRADTGSVTQLAVPAERGGEVGKKDQNLIYRPLT
jgi:hypothetical protein